MDKLPWASPLPLTEAEQPEAKSPSDIIDRALAVVRARKERRQSYANNRTTGEMIGIKRATARMVGSD